jgi:hypothetical protein
MSNTEIAEKEFIFVDDNEQLLSIFEQVYGKELSRYPRHFFPTYKLLLKHLTRTSTKQLIIILDYDLLEDKVGLQIADIIKKNFTDKQIIIAMFSNSRSPAELEKLDENGSVDWFINKLGYDSLDRLGDFLKFFTQAIRHQD